MQVRRRVPQIGIDTWPFWYYDNAASARTTRVAGGTDWPRLVAAGSNPRGIAPGVNKEDDVALTDTRAFSRRSILWIATLSMGAGLAMPSSRAQQASPAAGPTVVLETAKGTIEFETYPDDAPRTVGAILELVRKNFYNGQRFHRVEPNFMIQIGDPKSRDMSLREWWGRAGSGKPIGVSEISRKRRHVKGVVAMANSGSPKDADSQFYITLRATPELDSKHTVFGKVIKGLDVAAKIQKADVLKKASVRE